MIKSSAIVDIVRQKNRFADKNSQLNFAIGLRMFNEAMLKNRQHPSFEEFSPAMDSFMKKLKSS